ncbi:MAG: TonB family protein [Sulfuritalea sp.]|nr:TonB family protein [Sulfuritalea sp.]MDP1984210.1 TonB family protein [Sulfuritalea sp.]
MPSSPILSRLPRPALPPLPMPAFLVAMDAPQRNLTLAIGASLLIHAVLLAVHFTPPDFVDKARERALEVILVNSKSKSRPDKAQAKAQTNLDGGGNTDEDRRAKTPLPPSARTKEGDQLIEAKRRVAELEAQAQLQMTRLKSQRAVNANKSKIDPAPAPEPAISGVDMATSALAIARLEGQIARQMEEYNKRPRKKFIGARVEEYRFAQYVEDWRQKIERIGNLNYPDAAKGRLYGSLTLSVIIKANGDIKQVEVIRSSGQPLLDEAARRIVRMAAPYAAFPESIRRDTDELDITRTWTFTNADRLRAD